MQIPSRAINASQGGADRRLQARSTHPGAGRGPHKVGRALRLLALRLGVWRWRVPAEGHAVGVLEARRGDTAGELCAHVCCVLLRCFAALGVLLGDEITKVPPARRRLLLAASRRRSNLHPPQPDHPPPRTRTHRASSAAITPKHDMCATVSLPLLAASACHNFILKRVTCPGLSPFGPTAALVPCPGALVRLSEASHARWTDPGFGLYRKSHLPLPH